MILKNQTRTFTQVIFGLPAKFRLDDGSKGDDLPGSFTNKSHYG